jgi:hypothetical protein
MATVLLVVQVGLVVREQVLVVHAAREGARAAAVSGAAEDAAPAAARATGLDPTRLRVEASTTGSGVSVTARYRARVALPVLRMLVDGVDLDATVVMRREDQWA